jgi:hypothetical protein
VVVVVTWGERLIFGGGVIGFVVLSFILLSLCDWLDRQELFARRAYRRAALGCASPPQTRSTPGHPSR